MPEAWEDSLAQWNGENVVNAQKTRCVNTVKVLGWSFRPESEGRNKPDNIRVSGPTHGHKYAAVRRF